MFFDVTKSYDKMLNKIGIFTAFWLLFQWHLILVCFPEFKNYINEVVIGTLQLNKPIKIYEIELSFSYIIPLILSLVCRVIKLHNKVSDIFKIRYKYDLDNIIFPIAEGVGYRIASIEKVKSKRDYLMRKVFYRYAGYTNPQIDTHLINMALDSLCWYWIVIEWEFITCITLLICSFSDNKIIVGILIVLIVILGLACSSLKKMCIPKTKSEVVEILNDNNRKREILGVFNAL